MEMPDLIQVNYILWKILPAISGPFGRFPPCHYDRNHPSEERIRCIFKTRPRLCHPADQSPLPWKFCQGEADDDDDHDDDDDDHDKSGQLLLR